jgi:hypothetical protein
MGYSNGKSDGKSNEKCYYLKSEVYSLKSKKEVYSLKSIVYIV